MLGLTQRLSLHRTQALVPLHEFGKGFLLGGATVGTGSSSNIGSVKPSVFAPRAKFRKRPS